MAIARRAVFILGAGASKEAGGPLMKDFIDVAENLLLTGKLADADAASFQAVFTAIDRLSPVYAKSTLDLNNIETVFSAFEMAKLLDTEPRLIDHDQLIEAIRRLIVITLEKQIRFPVIDHVSHHLPGAPGDYPGFVQLLKELNPRDRYPISIITFNYDLALDYALYQEDIEHVYQLPNSRSDSHDVVHLLKLHGSLNWGRMAECPSVVVPWLWKDYLDKFAPVVPSRAGAKIVLPVASRISEFVDGEGNPMEQTPVIVPPTWSKNEHHQVLEEVWRAAAKDLEEAEHIFVIGYSLPETDHFFRYLFALGTMGKTRLKNIVVYDPQAGKIRSKYEAILGDQARERFHVEGIDFAGSLYDIRSRLSGCGYRK